MADRIPLVQDRQASTSARCAGSSRARHLRLRGGRRASAGGRPRRSGRGDADRCRRNGGLATYGRWDGHAWQIAFCPLLPPEKALGGLDAAAFVDGRLWAVGRGGAVAPLAVHQ